MAASLFQSVNLTVDSKHFYQYTTGSIIDIFTGSYYPGMFGEFILQGGIGLSNGIGGVANSYKSTFVDSEVIFALERYPDSYAIVLDTEASVDKNRIVNFANLYYDDRREKHLKDIHSRIRYLNLGDVDTLEAFIEVILNPVIEFQKKHKNSLLKKTPFKDPETGENAYVISPVFIIIDSYSEFKVKITQKMLDEFGISGSETNTIAMREGLIKARFFRDLSTYALKFGIIILMTAHVDTQKSMGRNPMAAPVKELPSMKGDTKHVNVGNKWKFLLSTVLGISGTKNMIDGSGNSEYLLPDRITGPNEFNSINLTINRCKNNVSNTKFKAVVSQTLGYQNGLTNFQILRDNKYHGLITSGNNANMKSIFLPDENITKKNSLIKFRDPKLSRAIEITAQLCVSKQLTNNTNIDLSISPEELMDKLSKSTYKVDDILNSRGWWTWEDTPLSKEQPYLSLPDIIRLVNKS